MYDRPETASANDALWSAIVDQLDQAPAHLDRDIALHDAWVRPDLFLSQTCGMPFKLWAKDHLRYVASPDYGLPETPPGHYHSVIITRVDDTRAPDDILRARAIINEAHSQSGYTALWNYAAIQGVTLTNLTLSGAHQASARAVADNTADIAAIDANTWRMIARWDDFASGLKVIARTSPTPAMPFVCGKGQDVSQVRAALAQAVATLTSDQRDTLGLYGIATLSADAYLDVPLPPDAPIAVKT